MNFRDLGYDGFGSRKIPSARKLTQQEIRNLLTYGNLLKAHKGDGTQIFNVDTTNGWVQIGKPQPASNYDPNVNLYLTDDIDDYYAVNMQNLSDSDQASTDFILLNDSTTPVAYLDVLTTGYLDMGVNSSTYNNPDYGMFTASSEFIDVGDDFFIGTIGEDNSIYFYTQGHESFDRVKISISPSGHLKFHGDAKPWRDETTDSLSLRSQGPGVSQSVTESTVDFIHTAQTSDYLYCNIQLNHDKDLESSIHPHIHFFQAENAVPNFMLQYRWQNNGASKVTSWTNYKCNTLAAAYSSGTILNIAYGAGISPPAGTGLSDIVQFRVIRDHDNASTLFAGQDPYTATVGVLSFDIHFQIDSLGSNEEYDKEGSLSPSASPSASPSKSPSLSPSISPSPSA